VSLVIKGGRVIDPQNGVDGVMDLRIDKGRIGGTGKKLDGDQVIDGRGLWVVPGLVDMHVHLREPGYEYKETIETGTRAAAAGGFTAVACMPNTDPVNDNGSVTDFILAQAKKAGLARVYPVGAITRGEAGESLAEIGEMRERGAVAVSDDGVPVMSSALMRRAMEYAKTFGLPVISHSEDLVLRGDGVMHEGEYSTCLGLQGIPAAAEECMVDRDIQLAELTGAALHIAHVSAAGSVERVRRAKEKGLRVTAEVTPHHLTLTDASLMEYDTNLKVNPPLRTEADRAALIAGLADGTIDAVASDHAPHNIAEKEVEFDQAAFGLIGLETSVPLLLRLVHQRVLTAGQLVDRMSAAPCRILGIQGGSLSIGVPADVALIDPEFAFTVDAKDFHSRSANSPFQGWQLQGKAVCTLLGGKRVYRDKRWQKESGRHSKK